MSNLDPYRPEPPDPRKLVLIGLAIGLLLLAVGLVGFLFSVGSSIVGGLR